MPPEGPGGQTIINVVDDDKSDADSLPDLESQDGEFKHTDIYWHAESNTIRGTFNPVLAVRVLRTYMLPESRALREEYRKQHREHYWQELSEIERTTMTEWAVCDYCTETSWCVRRNRAANPLANAQCCHCFNLEEVEA